MGRRLRIARGIDNVKRRENDAHAFVVPNRRGANTGFDRVLALRGERAFDNPHGHWNTDRRTKRQIKCIDAARPGGTQICGRTVVGEPSHFIGLRRGTEPADANRRRGGNDSAIVDLTARVLAIDHQADRLAAAIDHVDGIAPGEKHQDGGHPYYEGTGRDTELF